ncbi:hypothetical protein D9M72_237360 [compost metagenome]
MFFLRHHLDAAIRHGDFVGDVSKGAVVEHACRNPACGRGAAVIDINRLATQRSAHGANAFACGLLPLVTDALGVGYFEPIHVRDGRREVVHAQLLCNTNGVVARDDCALIGFEKFDHLAQTRAVSLVVGEPPHIPHIRAGTHVAQKTGLSADGRSVRGSREGSVHLPEFVILASKVVALSHFAVVAPGSLLGVAAHDSELLLSTHRLKFLARQRSELHDHGA